jgi:cholesterol oxidase
MYDYVAIGSGIGGSVVTRRLVERGASVCLLERGDFVKQKESNWDVHEITVKKRYQSGSPALYGRREMQKTVSFAHSF